MLQSKAGIVNKEYLAQKALFVDVDAGKTTLDEFFANAHELLKERLTATTPAKA